MHLRELSPEGPDDVGWEGLTVKSAPTNHIEGSLAFRIEAGLPVPGLFRGHRRQRLPGGPGPGGRSAGAGGGQPV